MKTSFDETKVFPNEHYHSLSCEIARNRGVAQTCICLDPRASSDIPYKFPSPFKVLNTIKDVLNIDSPEKSIVLEELILRETCKLSNEFENYQNAINEVSAILRVIRSHFPAKSKEIEIAAVAAGEKFLQLAKDANGGKISIKTIYADGSIELPDGSILGQPTVSITPPKV